MAWITDVWDRLKTAEPPTAIIFCAVGLIYVGVFAYWAETSSKNIKFWGVEITAPESDAIKACRAIQAAFHDKALGWESERQATYRLIESDQASIDAFSKLQLEARAGDRYTSDYDRDVVWRINGRIEDLKGRGKYLDWLNQAEAANAEQVNQECGSVR
jgi:hypothetical protein